MTQEFLERCRYLFGKTRRVFDETLRPEAQHQAGDLARQLLSRVAFLYFLQRQGWFGVGPDAAHYLRRLFKMRRGGENYFQDLLEPLFCDTLGIGRSDLRLPDALFSNQEQTRTGEIGTGILDVFDRFNFTVDEIESPGTGPVVDPEMLGQVFETLLDENLRYQGGAYYTPRVIVKYLCQQSLINYLESRLEGGSSREELETFIIHGERRPSIDRHAKAIDRALARVAVCDPALGAGAFLVGMMREIVAARLRLAAVEGLPSRTAFDLKREAIENSLYGVDLDPHATEIARLRLWLSLLADRGGSIEIPPMSGLDLHLVPGNALLEEDRGDQRAGHFLWRLDFAGVFREKGGFDIIIGNPPYIRIQEIQTRAPNLADYFKQRYSTASRGSYDLYILFVERGLSLLNAGGFLGYILPHKFFNGRHGTSLRRLIADGQHLLHVVHFGDQQIFAAATTYTCLMFLSKSPVAECRFVKVDDFEAWSRARRGSESRIVSTRLAAGEWNFMAGRDWSLFERLNRIPNRLEELAARIAQGIRTSSNPVYVLELVRATGETGALITAYSPRLGREVTLERDAVSLFLQGREIKPFQILPSGKIVVVPYCLKNETASLVEEAELKERSPHAFAYLLEHKSHLQNRENGKMKGAGWYGYGRLQNVDLMFLPKILVPDIADRASFALDEEGRYAFTSGYGITLKAGIAESPKYILGLLNSRLLDFYWRKVSTPLRGGFFRYFAQFIKQLPIRRIDFGDSGEVRRHRQVVRLVEYLLFMKPHLSPAAARDRQMADYFKQLLDALVYELYLPDELDAAGVRFFPSLTDEDLPGMEEIQGDRLETLRRLFDRLSDRDHQARRNLLLLETVESIRIARGQEG